MGKKSKASSQIVSSQQVGSQQDDTSPPDITIGDTVIAHGLASREDLNGLAGTVKKVDVARCTVCFSTGEIVAVKPINLFVEEVYEDMLTINGLNFCTAHHYEICGVCGFNFRMGNRLRELAWDPTSATSAEVYAKAEAIDAAEARENAPPRRAPGSSLQAPDSSLRRSQLVPANLDPSPLCAWDHDGDWPILQTPFLLGFSQIEIARMQQGDYGRSDEPEFALRQTLHVIAQAIDNSCADPETLAHLESARRGRGDGPSKIPPRISAARNPIPSFTIQDKAQSEAIMLHVVRVYESDSKFLAPGHAGLNNSLIEVRYTYNTVAGLTPAVLESIQAGMRLLPKGCLQQLINATVPEVRLLAKMLKGNHARLAPAFLAHASRNLPKGWHASVLMPLQAGGAKPEDPKCPQCGAAATKACSRCKKQRYCSAACQKAHWPTHKLTCRKPETGAAAGLLAVVNIRAAEGDAQYEEGMAQMQGMKLHNTSVQGALSARQSYSNFAGADDDALRDKMVPFKFQVPMASTDRNSAGMMAEQCSRLSIPAHLHSHLAASQDPRGVAIMAYDQRRRLQFKIYPSACAQHDQLVQAIRLNGVGGLKAYYNAYVTPTRELHIDLKEMLPPQTW